MNTYNEGLLGIEASVSSEVTQLLGAITATGEDRSSFGFHELSVFNPINDEHELLIQ